MHALIVVAHPCGDSFTHANAAAAERGLERAGHTSTTLDLYDLGFRSAMSRAERAVYHDTKPILDPLVAEHAKLLLAADAVVFVYPTWWSTVPAILKGWFDRVLVPGVGFRFDERTGKVRPGLSHLRSIIGISTYGSPRPYVRLMNDNGRRLITRTLRLSAGFRAKPTWLGLYKMDAATDNDRTAFHHRIEQTMASL